MLIVSRPLVSVHAVPFATIVVPARFSQLYSVFAARLKCCTRRGVTSTKARWLPSVRKLMRFDADRNCYMWDKVENDPVYREIARNTWRAFIGRPPPHRDTPEKAQPIFDKEIARAVVVSPACRRRCWTGSTPMLRGSIAGPGSTMSPCRPIGIPSRCNRSKRVPVI